MMDKQNDERDRDPGRHRGLRFVPAMLSPQKLLDDSLRGLIRRIQRPTNKRVPPHDDPPPAA